MKNKKHSYFVDDIRRMLLLYAIIPVVLLTLVCLLIFWGVGRYTVEKTTRNENRAITEGIDIMVDAFTGLLQMVQMQQEIFDGEIEVKTRVDIFEKIYEVSNRLGKKANIYVFDKDRTPIITGTKIVPAYLDGKNLENWGIFRIMKQNPEGIALKLIEDTGSGDMQLIIGKAMMNEDEIKGYALFVIGSKQFLIDVAKNDSQTVITDENGWVFVSNNYSLLDTLGRFNLKTDKKNNNITYDFGKFYITKSEIQRGRLRIYSIAALSNQIARLQYTVAVLLFVFAMMIISVLLSSKGMAAKKTKDLYTIIKAFERAKEGDLDTLINISSNDEFETIAEAYNQMLESLKEQIERNKEMGELVAFSQMKQLESQFNPHFLFNTLDNIRFMCKLDPPSASKMVLNLSILLRYSINIKQEEVTVNEDIAYTENYMSILKYRFNQRFQYMIDIPAEIEQCIIPKLLIQPMIENSIKYGFEGKEQLLVEISGYKEEGRLIVICSDNGAGIKPRVLKEIEHILMSSTNRSSHSGLYNINRRLQLKYGDAYGIQIESEFGNGTTLKVILPVRYGENAGGSDAENIDC